MSSQPSDPQTFKSESLGSTFFAQESVKRLREEDFTLTSKELVCVKYDDCMIVLFYNENTESKNVARLWGEAASQVSGPVFAACHMLNEKKVAEAFTRLNMDSNHPLHWAGLKQFPFILTYRKGWPQGFYNGERSVETFIDYGLTLACSDTYQEHQQTSAGMQAENPYEMSMWKKFDSTRTSSSEYKGTSPVRGYDPKNPVILKGSSQETVEMAKVKPAPSSGGATPITQGATRR